MKKIRITTAYLWAIACLILILVTFIKNDVLAKQMARLSFMKIHPRYSGGKEFRSNLVDGLNIIVNEPVYNGLMGKGLKGFVQIRFLAIKTMPDSIHEVLDYNFDGQPDFEISVNTANGITAFTPLNPHVKSLRVSTKVKQDWVVRVNIEREK